ncbi:MAG: hypothetical protein QXT45_04785 [Candidatus Bilamarchaeaceae archaeon]
MANVKPHKTVGTSYIDWQSISNASAVVGNAIDVSDKWGVTFAIQLGRGTSASPFTAGWPRIRVEGSLFSSGDEWVELTTVVPPVGSNLAYTNTSGSLNAGGTSLTVNSTSNIAAGDILFLGHPTDINKYELVRVRSISGSTVNLVTPSQYDHPSGSVVTDQAESYCLNFSTDAIQRMRIVIDNSNGGTAFIIHVDHAFYDMDEIV